MYAIVKAGGKQYKVTEGLVFETELVNAEVNSTVELEAVLVADENNVLVGAQAANAKVVATVVEHGKGKKVQLAIYKKMNGHHRAQGHRQPYSKIKIDAIKK